MGLLNVSGFVLAGGASTRMGRDKALLDWRGRTMLDHMIHLLQTAADPVQVVGRGQLLDRLPGLGPLSGIATGLEITSTDANLFVAVDLPHLTERFFKYLRSRLETSSVPLVTCKIGSYYPLCLGIWRPMLPEITNRLSRGQRSVQGLIEATAAEIISEEDLLNERFDLSIFQNINTPEDYSKL